MDSQSATRQGGMKLDQELPKKDLFRDPAQSLSVSPAQKKGGKSPP